MPDPRTYGMTTRAVELLAVIRAWKAEHGTVPTYSEMATELGVASKSTVHRLLTQLEDRGIVRRLFHKAQSVELIERHTIALPEHVVFALRHAARAAGRSPEDHAAEVILRDAQIAPSPF